jgi:5'-deoxynucleotidase YfbR-like HD superfamily hydrolase|tara:strand:+ start:416 stop:661 length:246 start_codon:yes stop_codon:yes gene_type:complete
MKSEELRKKSKELASKSEELQEKIYEAEQLEDLLEWANNAEGYITDILHNIGDVGIEEPHGWLSETVYSLVREIESKLEAL